MAVEQNPLEQIPQEEDIKIAPEAMMEDNLNATFEVDDDGGVIVDFTENTEMEATGSVAEWFGNMVEELDDEDLADIANTVVENFEADKDSRQEWESMFEKGFDLLGLKLEHG